MATFLSRFATSYSTDFDFTFPPASPKRGLRISEERATQSFHDSSHVSETKIVLDSGFWILGTGFHIVYQWNLDPGFRSKNLPDSGFQTFTDSGIGILDSLTRGVKLKKQRKNVEMQVLFWCSYYSIGSSSIDLLEIVSGSIVIKKVLPFLPKTWNCLPWFVHSEMPGALQTQIDSYIWMRSHFIEYGRVSHLVTNSQK